MPATTVPVSTGKAPDQCTLCPKQRREGRCVRLAARARRDAGGSLPATAEGAFLTPRDFRRAPLPAARAAASRSRAPHERPPNTPRGKRMWLSSAVSFGRYLLKYLYWRQRGLQRYPQRYRQRNVTFLWGSSAVPLRRYPCRYLCSAQRDLQRSRRRYLQRYPPKDTAHDAKVSLQEAEYLLRYLYRAQRYPRDTSRRCAGCSLQK